ncbi:Uncharacterized protein HZ326_5257 [Fusarium oxysporum f. sp. albedinis]|nr:Uncharacterized protein HZ326_5257 [Fusarium oxysporum f. sp. albedinis]
MSICQEEMSKRIERSGFDAGRAGIGKTPWLAYAARRKDPGATNQAPGGTQSKLFWLKEQEAHSHSRTRCSRKSQCRKEAPVAAAAVKTADDGRHCFCQIWNSRYGQSVWIQALRRDPWWQKDQSFLHSTVKPYSSLLGLCCTRRTPA